MLKVALFLFIIGAALLIWMAIDHSKEASVERARKIKKVSDNAKRNIIEPLAYKITSRASEKKIAEKELKYKKAGLKMSYAGNVFLCCGIGVLFFLIAFIPTKNIFLSVVMFAAGWSIPSLVITMITNKRIDKLDRQVGDFMRLLITRYQTSLDFRKSFVATVEDFEDREPMFSELMISLTQIRNGEPTVDILRELAKRCDNTYMERFADYYEVTENVGTENVRYNVLEQAVRDYEHDLETNRKFQTEISSITSETYIMLAFVPAEIIYSINVFDDYIPFMLHTTLGQIGSAVAIAGCLIILWYTAVHLGRPINREK